MIEKTLASPHGEAKCLIIKENVPILMGCGR